MTNEEKQALIEHAKLWIANAEAMRDELPFGFDGDTEKELSLIKIALAALTAQPDDWQQRAAAAEVEKAGAEERCRMMFDAKNHWAGRARTAEAKLAELEKQEPVAVVARREPTLLWEWTKQGKSIDRPDGMHLYSRPAPAINLAELVPSKLEEKEGDYQSLRDEKRGYNACIDKILRNIEEAK